MRGEVRPPRLGTLELRPPAFYGSPARPARPAVLPPIRLLLPFATGYLISYLFRVVNAVAGADISAEIGISPAELGFLTSTYFLAYAAVQLPLGVLLDRFRPNIVAASLMLIAAAGSAIFALGSDLTTLSVGRALIGLGLSASLMAAFKAYSIALRDEQLPLANGLQMAVGSLGLFAGGLPTELVIEAIGWRALFGGLALLTLAGAAALFLAVPKLDMPTASGDTLVTQIRDIGRVLASRAFLRFAPICIACHATLIAMQALWAGSWLREAAGLSSAYAATILSAMAVAMVLGFVIIGPATTWLYRRGITTLAVLIAGIATFFAVEIALIVAPTLWGIWLWPAFAFVSTSLPLIYPVLGALYPARLTGRVHTALNFLIFVAAFALQWMFGIWLEWLQPRLSLTGAYDAGLAILVLIQIAGAIWFVLARKAGPAAAE